MILERRNIRKAALGSAVVGATCLTLTALPAPVQMSIDLFFLVAVLFISLLQDRRLRQQTLAAAPDRSPAVS